MLKIIFLAFLLSLTGCGFLTPKEVIVNKVKTVIIEIPDPLLTKVDIEQPPDRKEYLSTDYKGKENILINYIIKLLGNLKSYDDRLISIKTFIENEKINLKKKEVLNE